MHKTYSTGPELRTHLDHLALLGHGERRLDVVAGDHDRPDLGVVQLLDRRLRLLLDPGETFDYILTRVSAQTFGYACH